MYKKISHIILNALLLTLLVSIFACASKKRKTDNPSVMTKFRQNTTAYYNGYFNADEILDLTYKDLQSTHQDNYNHLLALYPTMTDDIKGHKSELERANDKLIVVANDHEISHWRDDCYVMIGEIQFLLKDYESAEETFEYFMQEFDPLALKNRKLTPRAKNKSKKEKTKNRSSSSKKKSKKNKKRGKKKRGDKKKRESKDDKTNSTNKTKEGDQTLKVAEASKPKGGLFKHTPAYNEGMLWMARTYIERGKPYLALSLINRLEERIDLDKNLIPELKLAKAHYFINQKREKKATNVLKEAIILTKDKSSKARYWFVLGQLQLQSGDYSSAYESFNQVIKLKPVYEMHLHAELNNIKCQFHLGEGDLQVADKKLNRMLKDGKNESYQGEIYFILGGLYLASNQNEKALEYYNLAIQEGQNQNQKMEAFLALANLNYNAENYIEAKLYYDSTLAIMSNTEKRYQTTKKRANSLSEIALNMSIINLQDSLLKVSRMSKEEKLALAQKIAKREEEKSRLLEEKKSPAEIIAEKNPFELGGFNRLPSRQGSNFFAYNPVLVAKGKKEFKRKWGIRVLEDYWRLESKQPDNILIEEEEDDSNDEGLDRVGEKDLIRKYLSGIPKSPKQIQEANNLIEKAQFELGKLYRDQLRSNRKCIETLESLLQRYPNTQYKPTIYYYLHLAYVDIDDMIKSKFYADRLINDIPESLFAKLLSDPDFLENWLKEQNKLGNYYDETYNLYSDGEYSQVIGRVAEVESLFGPDNKYSAKFAMLNAMSQGSVSGKEGYILSMKDFIAKYPDSPESTRAKEILRFLRGDKGAFVGDELNDNLEFPQFSFNEDEKHYIIVVIHEMKSSSLSKLKIDISKYNRKYHNKSKLKMSSIDLDLSNSTPVIMMRKYANKKVAMKYYKGVIRKMEKFIAQDVHFDLYAISQRNYREVIKEKTVNNYMKFFEAKYLQN